MSVSNSGAHCSMTTLRKYGAGFAELLPTCRVWVNGEDVDDTRTLAGDDEVAILPPVSGG